MGFLFRLGFLGRGVIIIFRHFLFLSFYAAPLVIDLRIILKKEDPRSEISKVKHCHTGRNVLCYKSLYLTNQAY